MPAIHQIDIKNKIIITTWDGEPTAGELADALIAYQEKLKCKPEYRDFNEIVDFSETKGGWISSDGLRRLVTIAQRYDRPDSKIKLAIVVKSTLAFGLARMYETFRSFSPKITKEMRVYRVKAEALRWVVGENAQD